jgi:hypothetical protein
LKQVTILYSKRRCLKIAEIRVNLYSRAAASSSFGLADDTDEIVMAPLGFLNIAQNAGKQMSSLKLYLLSKPF